MKIIIKKIYDKLNYIVGSKTAIVRHVIQRKNLKNRDVSIISQNCLEGVVSHDLNLRFLSPTINLYMNSDDFLTFVENIKLFKEAKLEFIKSNYKYPVGILRVDDFYITIHFVHYKNESEAEKKWKDRFKRINYDKLCILMTDRDGFNIKNLKRFEALPYKKILFTSKLYKSENIVFIERFSGQECVGDTLQYVNVLGKRCYEEVNMVKFLNSI